MRWFGKRREPAPPRTSDPDATGATPSPPPPSALDLLRKRVEEARLPDAILAAARDECERLAHADSTSPEYAIGFNYLDFIMSLPWTETTKDHLDLARAKEILDARHHGLDRVKERILEFLAVKSLHSRRTARILLVDDEIIARENLSIVFEKDGLDVTAVANGLEAVAAMEQKPADIVVSDLKMEGMDGLELLTELRRRWPDTKVIMLTGYATVKTAVAAIRQGADQYLGKPVNLTKLRKHVEELLEEGLGSRLLRGPVLCFTGPPGTGKTSIGRAIAEAMGRKFFRMSLAGLRDEAELRGHRRTYVGAMPGRVLQGVRKAGSRNPVIMLDEMDKVIQDFQGDPSSVLLELLDPEQNAAFMDHYLGLPFDLSGALFIATANMVERLPAPLRDRMEVIEFSSYTPSEKQEITTRYLIPDQLKRHGLESSAATVSPEAVALLVSGYTREAGLRGLEKQVAALCRKLARQTLEQPESTLSIGLEDLSRLLGPPPFSSAKAQLEPRVGLATSLVWTENGGEIIFIEAARMPGNKQLILTGSLGEVLRESARTALSYIRSHAHRFDIEPDFFEASDIHVHIPAGAVPKEGPSAGTAILVAMLSLLTGRPVRQDTALSGELSLLGEVLPVGGIREKLMAARQAGLGVVVLPEKCGPVLDAVEREVLTDMDVRLVSDAEAAAEIALVSKNPPGA